MTVTRANSEDWRSWNGSGRLQLHDGLLWDVPIMAIMSPLLNAFSPGLGNSRATEATAPFTLTNGVIRSDEVLIRSTMMRLQYTGTVDLQETVDARVTAQLKTNESFIAGLIREGQADGSIPDRVDADDTARLMICMTQGLRVVGKARLPLDGERLVGVAMKLLA